MKSLFLSLIILATAASKELHAQSADFYRYSPSARKIGTVQYPRNGVTLYRGTTDGQMDLEKAVKAMFRDPTVNVESFFFSSIKHKLMGKAFSLEIPLTPQVYGKVKEAISDNGGSLDEKSAVKTTLNIVDEAFKSYGKYKNESLYINYNSPSFIDWPKDIVFASIVSPAASTYGDRIIIINERKPRALDLNFWNLVNNSKDKDHDRDVGEFSTPGYILYSDIDGYEIRKAVGGGVLYGFHRIEVGGDTFILVMDGLWIDNKSSSKCIVRTGKWDIVHCHYPGGRVMSPPPATDKPVNILGVIALCDSEDTCHLPSEIYQNMTHLSSNKLPPNLEQKIEKVSTGGKKAFYIPAQ